MLFAVVLAGCGGKGGESTPSDGTRLWTVMVFIAADNNLERYAIRNINELEMVGSTPQVSIVVQIDRIKSPSYDESNGNWDTTRRYYITKDEDTEAINSQLIADLGELDMAAPETLADFIRWGVETYPAENYLLVLWDHGRGWQTPPSKVSEGPARAISIDVTNDSEMSLSELTEALLQSPRMSVVAFDACLMGMLEVAYSIDDCTDIMVASEENVPVEGLPYQSAMSTLTSSPGLSSLELSRCLVDEYINRYSSLPGTPTTCSAISLASLDRLVTTTDSLARVMQANINTDRTGIRTAQQQAQHYDFENSYYTYYKDLYDFARQVEGSSGSTEVRSAAQDTMDAISDTVLYQRNSRGVVSNSHGISIYLPNPGSMLSPYSELDFAQATGWDEFLASY